VRDLGTQHRKGIMNFCDIHGTMVIKPGLGVDLALAGSQVTPGQPRKIKKKIFEVLISHMKKLRNNSCGSGLYIYIYISHVEKLRNIPCECRL